VYKKCAIKKITEVTLENARLFFDAQENEWVAFSLIGKGVKEGTEEFDRAVDAFIEYKKKARLSLASYHTSMGFTYVAKDGSEVTSRG